MARPIFRKAALDRLASPDQLDQLMQLTSPRAWIALLGLGLLLFVALLWSLFGTLSTTVEGQGVLVAEIQQLRATRAGVVQKFLVQSGDEVQEGQPLVQLAGKSGEPPTTVVSPMAGWVLRRNAKLGDSVPEGAALLTLQPLADRLFARLFIPVSEAYQIEREDKVRVWPASVKRDEFGYLIGKVVSAARFPITRAEILDRVSSEELVNQLTASGPCLQVIVELTADPGTESGFRWSSGKGPPLHLYSGTPCRAQITTDEYRPIQFLFSGLRGSGKARGGQRGE
jgi:hypothetical protein